MTIKINYEKHLRCIFSYGCKLNQITHTTQKAIGKINKEVMILPSNVETTAVRGQIVLYNQAIFIPSQQVESEAIKESVIGMLRDLIDSKHCCQRGMLTLILDDMSM